MPTRTEPRADGWIRQTRHYENYPVASRLVPARLRPALAAVYRFARYADDVADEGSAAPAQRIAELDRMEAALRSTATHPLVEPLRPYLATRRIEPGHLCDLLSAFRQDVTDCGFADRASLLHYCSRSANPIGRIMLHLFEADRPPAIAHADDICTGLQLINFVQDMGQDALRGRCYVPGDELAAAKLRADDIVACARKGCIEPAVAVLARGQISLALRHLADGTPLLRMVPARLRLELAAIIAGGHTMALRLTRDDPFASRIKLGRRDAPALLVRWFGLALSGRAA